MINKMKCLTSRWFIVPLFMVVCGIAILSAAPEAHAADEYDALRNKWKNYLTGADKYTTPVTDSDISSLIATITSRAQDLWDTMDTSSGRTYLWSDNTTSSNSYHIRLNYERLYYMALAYSTKGSSLENDSALLADIKDGLDWVYNNQFNESLTWQQNTHYWEIIIPQYLTNTVVLLYDQLSSMQITNYMNAVGKFADDCTDYGWWNVLSTGSNRVDEGLPIILRGIIVKDGSRITHVTDALSEAEGLIYPFVDNSDGWRRDGSFVYHNKHPYTGSYGLVLYNKLLIIKLILDGSTWELQDPREANVHQWTKEGFLPLMHHGRMMNSVMGRSISRLPVTDSSQGRAFINMLLDLVESSSAEDALYYKGAIKDWIQKNTFEHYYENVTSLNNLIRAKEIVSDSGITAQQPIMNKQYSGMDRVVHRRPDFAFGVSMSSSRIYNFESINNENLKGWYTGEGMTYIYDADIAQYAGDFWPTIDPKRLPGTTIDAGLSKVDGQDEYLSSSDWVGGTEIGGLYGTAGMQLDAEGSSLAAKKSWFMFNDEVVALGSDISSSDNRTIETIIENKKLNSAGDNALAVDGTTKSSALGWSETMNSVDWIHLQGNVSGADMGYYFPQSSTVKGLRESRTGAWYDINSYNGTTDPKTESYMTLWFDHGTSPTQANYSYVLLPGMSSTQVSSYASSPDVTVLENSSYVQAVKETELDIVAANFWDDITRTVDIITSHNKASVMTWQNGDELEVSVSDPTHLNQGLIEVEINKSAAGIVLKDPEIMVKQMSPTIKIAVQVNGSMGVSKKIKFNTQTEPTPSSSVIFTPTADALVTNGTHANSNFGTDLVLSAQDSTTSGSSSKAYLKFDLTSVNSVTSAKLRLYGSTSSSSISTLKVNGASIDSWTETGIQWSNAPAPSPGLSNMIYVNGIEQYYELDVTEMITQEVAGDNTATLVISGIGYEDDELLFRSKEYSSFKPQLEIVGTYTSPAPVSVTLDTPDYNAGFQDDFEGYTIGSAPTGWTADSSGGPVAVQQFSGSSGDKDLKLTDSSTSSGSSATKTFTPSSGLVRVEFKARAAQTNQLAGVGYTWDSSGNAATSMQFGADGLIKVFNGNTTTLDLQSYEQDTWYIIRLDINTDDSLYDVYIDEIKRASGIQLRNRSINIEKLQFYFGDASTGTLYIDDVHVYEASPFKPSYAVDDQFNTETTGAAPSHWTTGAGGGTVDIAEVPSAGDKSIRLYDNSSAFGVNAAREYAALEGRVTVEYKVKAEQTNQVIGAPYVFSNSGSNAASILLSSNGYIKAYDGASAVDLQAYSANTWYTIKLVMDTDKDTYNIYIDDVLKGWNFALRNAVTDISKMDFYFSNASTGTMYLDDIKVYEGSPVQRFYAANDHFNTETTGAAPSRWTTGASGGTVDIAEVPSTSDKSIRLNDNSGTYGVNAARQHASLEGIVTVEYKIRAAQTNQVAGSPYVHSNSRTIAASVLLHSNGFIRAYDGAAAVDLQAYSADTWYAIKLVMDTDKDSYHIYIDDVLVGWNFDLRNAVTDISKMDFYFSNASTGTMYIDDVKVY